MTRPERVSTKKSKNLNISLADEWDEPTSAGDFDFGFGSTKNTTNEKIKTTSNETVSIKGFQEDINPFINQNIDPNINQNIDVNINQNINSNINPNINDNVNLNISPNKGGRPKKVKSVVTPEVLDSQYIEKITYATPTIIPRFKCIPDRTEFEMMEGHKKEFLIYLIEVSDSSDFKGNECIFSRLKSKPMVTRFGFSQPYMQRLLNALRSKGYIYFKADYGRRDFYINPEIFSWF